MKKLFNNKNGSLITEAAIFLPIFIIGLVSLMYVIKILLINEVVVQSMFNEARKMSVESYTCDASNVDGVGVIVGPLAIKDGIESMIVNSNTGNDCEINVKNYRFLFNSSQMNDLISFSVECSIKPSIPAGIIKEVNLDDQITFRAWTGEENGASPMGFDRMSENEDSEIVYIFPYSGKKYHKLSCPYISVYPEKTILTKMLMKRFSPCALCDSYDVSEGSTVYCFSDYGRVYHKADCTAVKKYIEKIDKADAELKGYQPCSKCGG